MIDRRQFLRVIGACLLENPLNPLYAIGKTPNISSSKYNQLSDESKWKIAARLLHGKYTLDRKIPDEETMIRIFDDLTGGAYSENNEEIPRKEVLDIIDECSYIPDSDGIITKDLVLALIEEESARIPNQVSVLGAGGLTQVMPKTWTEHTEENFYRKVFAPPENIYTGTRFLNWLEKLFRNNEEWGNPEWMNYNIQTKQAMILAGFHGGASRLKESGWSIDSLPVTRKYVRRIMEKLI